jgi:nucleoside-diphosphate-sugar epimerase
MAGMDNSKTIACVTGASGMVGSKIVRRLALQGYKIRALSRSKHFDDPDVELFRGGLDDEEVLKSFLSNAHLLFHCAAELYDESKMWDVNVLGTERLLRLIKNSSIEYLCYLSSAGVVGRTNIRWVNEKTGCDPQNVYEQSKWAAEQLVAQGIDGCQIVILRPTNVIDCAHCACRGRG